jgi:glycine/D-amino acid oxidase-like deaminating enzyme/nitrite reductase/ring-hydroxylating ferredoxin subunit
MQERAKGESTSPYWESASLPRFPRVEANTHADVVVVGAGITGLTTAYLLARGGRSVIVLERDRCAHVDTGHTTAHLTMVTDERLTDLTKRFGETHAQAVWDAGLAAINQIDETVRSLDIECGFAWVDGYLHLPRGQKIEPAEVRALRDETDAAGALGFDATFLDDVPLVGGPGVRFDNQARFHPRRYLAGLAEAITREGGRIYEHSAADEFQADGPTITSGGHTIRCEDIVIATHNPLVGLAGIVSATLFQTKLVLMSSYVIGARVPAGSIADALFWDTQTAYEYLRIDPHGEHDAVIFGGQDHKTGQADDTAECSARLEKSLLARVPGAEITHRWSGQVIETPDGLPYIGRMAEHQYAATGFAGNGMTFGTLAGMMIADAILGRSNPWADLFAPNRSVIRAAWDYVKENVDYPYYLIRDRFAGADGRSLRAVKRGEGKIIERDGAKAAVYRAPDGNVTIRSATCTHMGCVVAWNPAERTWDCPCHGSRFKPTGDVLSGPAESPLSEIDS